MTQSSKLLDKNHNIKISKNTIKKKIWNSNY